MTARLMLLGEPAIVTNDGIERLPPMEALFVAYLNDHHQTCFQKASLAKVFWPFAGERQRLRSLSQMQYHLTHKRSSIPLAVSKTTIGLAGKIPTDEDELADAVANRDYLRSMRIVRGRYLSTANPASHALEDWLSRKHGHTVDLLDRTVESWILLDSSRDTAQAAAVELWRLTDSGYYSLQILIGLAHFAKCAAEPRLMNDALSMLRHDFGFELSLDDAEQNESEQNADGVAPHIPFVGRRAELDQLLTWLKSSQSGKGEVVVLTGEPGIGKTRLATQLLRVCALRNVAVWSTSCSPATKRATYTVIIQLLESIATGARQQDISNLAASVAQSVSGADHSADPQLARHRVFSRVSQLVELQASISPLVIFIDDIQWSDEATSQLIVHLALHVAPHRRVLLLLTYRSQDVERADWVATDLVTARRLELAQFDVETTTAFVSAFERASGITLGANTRTQVIWQSAGRPFLLLQSLLTAAQEPAQTESRGTFVPEPAEALLRRRFHGLDHQAMWLAGIVAAIGQPVPLGTVAAIGEYGDQAAAELAEQLIARGILQASGVSLAYPHELMREVAYRLIPEPTRALIHSRLAQFITSSSGDPGAAAQHYALSGDTSEVASCAAVAARRAYDRGFYSDAEYYYDLAIRHGDPAQREDASLLQARLFAQIGRAEDLSPLIEHLKSPEIADEANLLRMLADIGSGVRRGNNSAVALMESARCIARFIESRDNPELALAVGHLVDLAYEAPDSSLGDYLLSALGSATSGQRGSQMQRHLECLALLWHGVTRGVSEPLHRLHTLPVDSEAEPLCSTTGLRWFALGTLQLLAGRLGEAETSLIRSRETALRSGDIHRQSAAAANLSVVLVEKGEIDNARILLESALSSPNIAHRLRAYANLATMYYEVNEFDLSRRMADMLLRANATYGADKYCNTAWAVIGLTELADGNFERALAARDNLVVRTSGNELIEGDLGYTIPFIAEVKVRQRSLDSAVHLLREASEVLRDRDEVARLRVQLALSRTLVATDPEQAFLMSRAVVKSSKALGAAMIAQAADRMGFV